MSAPVFFAVAVLGSLAAFAWFVHLERTGRHATSVLAIVSLLVLETLLFPNQNLAPAGPLHPGFGGDPNPADDVVETAVSFRWAEVLVVLALAARLVARGPRLRLTTAGLLWLAFTAWLGAELVMGILSGNSSSLATFEGKAIVYVGFFLLVAGVPAHEYTTGPGLRRVLYGSALVAALLLVLRPAGVDVAVDVPLLGSLGSGIGTLQADTATLFVSLGVIALAFGACSDRHRLGLLVASVPLLASPVVADQRAAYLGLAVAVGVLALALPLAWRRVRTTPTELALVLGTAVACLAVVLFVGAVMGRANEDVPIVTDVQRAFGGAGNELSAQARVNQWTQARALIAERPLLGHGLGTTYDHYDPGPRAYVQTDLTHNIGLDLLVRTGIVGLVFFVAAALLTTRDGLRTWLRAGDSLVAALALAGTAILLGIVAKGMVESVFEKFRLAMFVGLAIGLVGSTAVSVAQEAWPAVVRRPRLARGQV